MNQQNLHKTLCKNILHIWKEIAKVITKSIDAKTDLMVQGVKFTQEHVPIVAVYDLYLNLEVKIKLIKKLVQIRQHQLC